MTVKTEIEKLGFSLAMVKDAFNPSTQETEAAAFWVQGHPGL